MGALEKDRRVADKLLQLSKEGDSISGERVSAVLQSLREKPPARHVQILREYSHLIEREIARSTAVIETATPLDASTVEQIRTDFTKRYQRTVTTEVVDNDDLIAGLRISIGDDVWDDSIATHLNALKR